MQPLWYRTAVTYAIDVAMFHDSDGDGWGDLRGVTERLPYLRGLGIDCLWLLPFYRSPYRDGGYDVVDHLSVDPRFGDLADFGMLLDTADDLGLRVIIDLVAQHTSIDHPWFQKARRDRSSPYRGYYVWADEPEETDVEPMFPTVEDSVWTWDDEAQQYYRHTFYAHEPDLELGHPEVRAHIDRMMSFWLRMGVSGFRVDALPSMVERARAADRTDDGLWLVEHLRDFVTMRRGDAVLLGEVDVPVKEYANYFGDGRRMTMLLDFWTNNHVFAALAERSSRPLVEAVRERPEPPRQGQYGTFLRNHDELDLERLSEERRRRVLDTFAPEDDMRIYGRGIRRRLAPMLGGDERRIAMAFALLMSLPGSPVLLYGDEIGMGDDLSRTERRSVRTPMQWSATSNAGFSTASPERLAAPLIDDGPFSFETVNVQDQVTRDGSLLSTVSNLIRTRAGQRVLSEGSCRAVDVAADAVLCLVHEREGRFLLTLVNLSPDEVTVDLPSDLPDPLVEILGDGEYDDRSEVRGRVRLRGHGYRWLLRPDDLAR